MWNLVKRLRKWVSVEWTILMEVFSLKSLLYHFIWNFGKGTTYKESFIQLSSILSQNNVIGI
jgi:hypothetical protein